MDSYATSPKQLQNKVSPLAIFWVWSASFSWGWQALWSAPCRSRITTLCPSPWAVACWKHAYRGQRSKHVTTWHSAIVLQKQGEGEASHEIDWVTVRFTSFLLGVSSAALGFHPETTCGKRSLQDSCLASRSDIDLYTSWSFKWCEGIYLHSCRMNLWETATNSIAGKFRCLVFLIFSYDIFSNGYYSVWEAPKNKASSTSKKFILSAWPHRKAMGATTFQRLPAWL